MKFKKIVAREFLILILCLVILGISYLILSTCNARIEKKNISILDNYEKYSDSLLISVKTLNVLAEDYAKKLNFYFTPEYLIVFYSREIPITQDNRNDINEYSFNYWVDAIQKNEEYKRGIFYNYILHSFTDKMSFDEWEQQVFKTSKIDSLKSLNEVIAVSNYLDKKQNAIIMVAKTKEKLHVENFIIVLSILLVGLAYLLRFLIYGIRWSIKTLKE